MFVDSVDIIISSGKGGAGAISFRREKFVLQGGPDGGDGGDGGDVYFQSDFNNDTLSKFRGKKHYKALNGLPGRSKKQSGKSGEDIIIKVPLGTQIINYEDNSLLYDFTKDEKILFLKGGKGGAGNFRFKNSINQKPTYAQKGLEGQTLHIKLELKIIANVGLVGFPNVGKSTLLSIVSNATPEIANYEFTTLLPNLGVVNVDDFNSFVMADIPGIINGASLGKGLGIEFLKHIERTKIFLFMLDSNQALLKQFLDLISEIKNFKQDLGFRDFGIAITKIDSVTKEDLEDNMNLLFKYFNLDSKDLYIRDKSKIVKDSKEFSSPIFILPISSLLKTNIDKLVFLIFENLKD